MRMSTEGNSIYFAGKGFSWHDSGDEALETINRLLRDERISRADAMYMRQMIEKRRHGQKGETYETS